MRWTHCVLGVISLLSACNDAPTAESSPADQDSERGTPVVVAKVARNTIDPIAALAGNGHHLSVTGPIGCTAGQWAELRVTVTQRTTGAVAEGRTRVNLHRQRSDLAGPATESRPGGARGRGRNRRRVCSNL